MALSTGTRVGVYEIVGPVGAGGMGEVYRARDPKLDRDVALKVLPHSVASDPDRVARFEREARTLAGLNHPNIAHVYGFEQTAETSALIMELVSGEDLSTRLTRGPMAVPDALAAARQIIDALEFAHAQHVIHRDLKPANIKIRPDGTVKILDFGLAKALDPLPSNTPEQHEAATVLSPAMTMQGVILGTAAYMSPEQARGHAVDQRADIWAFGVVLYEMLAGKVAFAAPTVTDTLARVIEREPDWSALPAATPATVRTLLRRCLEKDPRKRAPHIGLARLDVDDALSGSPVPTPAPAETVVTPAGRTRSPAVLVPAALLIGIVAAAAGYLLKSDPPASAAVTYRSLLLLDENMNSRPPTHRFSISPDGRWIAYVGTDEPGREARLFLRSLADGASQAIVGTDGAGGPFWSPDSRAFAYFVSGQIWRADVGGGPPVKICDVPGGQLPLSHGSWGANDLIIFSHGQALWRVSPRGGQPQSVLKVEDSGTQAAFPWLLPDGRHVLFTEFKGIEPVGVFAVDLTTGKRTRILETGSNVQFANGNLVFLRGTALVAQPFDPATLSLSRDPVTLADPIMGNVILGRAGAFSVSQTGSLLYIPLYRGEGSRLAWITRDGKQTVVDEIANSNRGLALSPDGTRAALITLGVDGLSELWLVDLKRQVRNRISTEARPSAPVWSRDGRTLYYTARQGRSNIYSRGDYGSGTEQTIYDGGDADKRLTSISSDSRTMLFESARGDRSGDVFVLTLDPTPRETPLLQSPFMERDAQLSPDGQWFAYTTTASGQGDQVYVARFPTGAHQTRVSTKGGTFPRWHPSGRELIFFSGDRLFTAALTLKPDGADIGAISPLFPVQGPEGFARTFYDVAPDGRFLVSMPSAQSTSSRLGLLTNWMSIAAR